MKNEVIFLGGLNDSGGNSIYLNLEGTGIIIDAGLHPKFRDERTFPDYHKIIGRSVDLVILTHAHTDHIGALPYLLKFFPHVRIFTTRPTRDLLELILVDTAKLLRSEAREFFTNDILEFYDKKILEHIWMLAESYKLNEEIRFKGMNGAQDIKISFYHSGHILGSAAVLIEHDSKNILHTGDINFRNQAILKGAELPKHHIDSIISECTNGGFHELPLFKEEKNRFAKFINEVINENGSILIPAFSLGKTQEILKVCYDLMISGKIPQLPIYTGGLGVKINRIYDKYCYEVPFIKPGFEVSDIPFVKIDRKNLFKGDYLNTPGIVVISSGMMNRNTYSYNLSKEWLRRRNFAIAFVGYLDEDSPGYQLASSEAEKDFELDGSMTSRKCRVEQFRFSAHARHQDLIENIQNHKPNEVFLFHGDDSALHSIYEELQIRDPGLKKVIPEIGKEYNICKLH